MEQDQIEEDKEYPGITRRMRPGPYIPSIVNVMKTHRLCRVEVLVQILNILPALCPLASLLISLRFPFCINKISVILCI